MKTAFTTVIALATFLCGSAQVRWGAEAGVNMSHGYDTSKSMTGFNIGATAEYDFGNRWFVDAALKLSSQPCGDKYLSSFANPSKSEGAGRFIRDTEYRPYYLTLPVRIGCNLTLTPDIDLRLGVGPMVGVGLFGKGTDRHIPQSDKPEAITTNKSSNVFNSKGCAPFSSSRFEYGAQAKIAFVMKGHYSLGVEYSLIHISSGSAGIDNVGVASVNLGYIF